VETSETALSDVNKADIVAGRDAGDAHLTPRAVQLRARRSRRARELHAFADDG